MRCHSHVEQTTAKEILMRVRTVFDYLKRRSSRTTARPARRGAAQHRPAASRLQLETLEDRCLLSTSAGFDLATPQSGPFPSDRFTVADFRQLTNRRVDLPLPDRDTH